MSPKTIFLTAGLTALGLVWSATRCVALQSKPPATVAPPASAPSLTVLMLSNGQVLQGDVREDESEYVLTQKVGEIRFPKRKVERAFGSLQEVYRYKVERLANQDPDEHLKLAQWCLAQNLNVEAIAQLESVLALAPDNDQAKKMIFGLNTAMKSSSSKDEKIERTGHEVLEPDAPAELKPGVLDDERNQAAVGMPVIPGLPPALAVKRYQEFARFVHPELQKHCASCHNERSEGAFQLIQARNAREMMSDTLMVRNNLDATLRLVAPGDPAHSELLIKSVMPHPPTNRPILSGPNHRAYQVFATWIGRLQPPASPDGAAQAGFAAPPAPGVGGFATDRRAPIVAPTTQVPFATPTVSPPVEMTFPDPGAATPNRIIPGGPPASATAPPPDSAFQTTSPLLGGPTAAPVPTMRGSTNLNASSPAPRPPATKPGKRFNNSAALDQFIQGGGFAPKAR